MKYRWRVASPQPLLTTRLVDALHISPLLAQCLVNRGLDDPDQAAGFLRPRLQRLSPPEQLPNLSTAVERLRQARDQGERVVIFGDYDVDGITATALLLQVLRALGWQVEYYLPNRLEEGYGLSREAVENCRARFSARLILAVDCGSTAVRTITWLATLGVEVIVLDHHQVSAPPPPAVALVNPRVGCTEIADERFEVSGKHPPTGVDDGPPQGELCSVGLAFKLAHGLVKRGRAAGEAAAERFDIRPLLDLVALGTIADLVPLTGENRILVTAGLERLNRRERPGVRALAEVAGIRGDIGPYEVGFQLAPRLNAAGRLESASEALDLVLARTPIAALPLARSLNARNEERQSIERRMAEEVIGAVRARFDPAVDYVIVEGQLLWHVGVVGIVASRVVQAFYRPVIILGGDGHEWRGSGRSIDGFDLAAALRECDDLLLRHGGHAMAAGLTLHPDNVPRLRTRLNELARHRLRREHLVPPLLLDATVAGTDLTLERLRELALLSPSGQGNPAVHVVVPNLTLHRGPTRVGRDRQHLKFWVTDGSAPQRSAGAHRPTSIEAVWWNGAERPWPEGCFDLACAPQINEFNDRLSVELKVLDWRPHRD